MLFATEGERAMSEVHLTGTSSGEIVLSDFGRGSTETTGETFPATGRFMDVTGVIVHEFGSDGLIVAERQYWNMLELLTQLRMFTPLPES